MVTNKDDKEPAEILNLYRVRSWLCAQVMQIREHAQLAEERAHYLDNGGYGVPTAVPKKDPDLSNGLLDDLGEGLKMLSDEHNRIGAALFRIAKSIGA